MAKILVLYYSMYGHIEQLAEVIAAGAAEVENASVVIKRVPELMPENVARSAGAKLDQKAPIAQPNELADYDAIFFGTPTRFGNMCSQMRNFLDQIGGLWMKGAMIGKVGSIFTSTGTGGGNETTILTFFPTLIHLGMIIVGVPYSAPHITDISEVRGGSAYGAGTVANLDGSRQPTEKELALARYQGHHVASIAKRLFG